MTPPLWGRPVSDQWIKWCRVELMTPDTVITKCRGRFPAFADHEVSHNPPQNERCLGCQPADDEPTQPMPVMDWDTSDVER